MFVIAVYTNVSISIYIHTIYMVQKLNGYALAVYI